MNKTVHFGAGNIGRGFIGALFAKSGYEVTFVDIAENIIDKLNEEKTYEVILAKEETETEIIKNVAGLNNRTQEDEVIEAIQHAAFVTTAIGPNILPRIAPLIARGLVKRAQSTSEKIYVIACENQIGATDILKGHIFEQLNESEQEQVTERVSFLNSAVDRIVPIQDQNSLDVLVEPYYEWVVESKEEVPSVEGMTTVENLAPFIERKLFTVNTGHAVIAYLGYSAGKETIDETLADQEIQEQVLETLKETGAYLIHQYGLNEEEHNAYIHKNIDRFKNKKLNDLVTRVGRAPLRKLGPQDRLIRPAVEAEKAGLSYSNLAKAIASALLFDHPEDEEAMKMQQMIEEKGPEYVLHEVSKLEEGSDLTGEVVRIYEQLRTK
ncbi:mannitol-1-phosphate 5-dehydrogenase [Halobacillus litoralis]|uniref:mannitol-1-phosphate 5-dehydrogenase n=1 Tax=Halobacillus litoralis TaxID=45668 RepID=UPI001CFE24B8|nr:mannitol-1-phosphate 5-dehydrogenase [Halobacillus litoralis]